MYILEENATLDVGRRGGGNNLFSPVRIPSDKQHEEENILYIASEKMIIHLSVFRSCPFAFFCAYI
jgi:hypothetical protein